MKAAGYGAWWNQYGERDEAEAAMMAAVAGLDFVIVKYGQRAAEIEFEKVGVPWATERYVLPGNAAAEGTMLANAMQNGAAFAVINAEVEWEGQPASAMQDLIAAFRLRAPMGAELYASTDTRGNRLHLPYQQVLAQHITGWMPMIYPMAFYPDRPTDMVARAFASALDGKAFSGKPVLPTIQGYDAIGDGAVNQEMHEVKRRGLPGAQLYTIRHATQAEWGAFIASRPAEEEDDMLTPDQAAQLAEVAENVRDTRWAQGIHHMIQKDAAALELVSAELRAQGTISHDSAGEAVAVIRRYRGE